MTRDLRMTGAVAASSAASALLGEHGYTVGRYVSLEQEIAESADAYYQALLDSTHGWLTQPVPDPALAERTPC